MSRLGLYAGTMFERALSLVERHAPEAAFRLKRHFYRPDMEFALRLLQRNGFAPRAAIDVGAYQGSWARLCRAVFPECDVLMLEPSAERVRRLRELCSVDPRLSVIEALVGAEERAAAFHENESNSGVTSLDLPGAVNLVTRPLEQLVAGTEFRAPDLIKIDVQGYDLEVLKGARSVLQSVQIIIVEVSLIPLNPLAPSVREIVDWLDERDFRLFDICGFMRRPNDDALWQIDAVFARKESAFGGVASGWR